MKIIKQAPVLKEIWHKQLDDSLDLESSSEQYSFKNLVQRRNRAVGNLGESFTVLFAMSLPDTWMMCQNALIPTTSGKLTEIDVLLVGSPGIFLLEIKTWTGAYQCQGDHWQRWNRKEWVAIENSPSKQSLYHQQAFTRWLDGKVSGIPENAIVAPVLFTAARRLNVSECSAPVFHGFKELRPFLKKAEPRLTPEQVSVTSQAIANVQNPSKTY
ncbi:MAG: hypothetical protein N5P05_004071 (plasmid) [Chroococcopsis gigantea SAG 12.99]|jgi:hypothetical protein|nr:hypothetical protein [Chroococcopsis gigantea SAG 12.99]